MLPVMNRSILVYYMKLVSCIQLKNQNIKTLNVSSVMENFPKMNEGKFGSSVSAACAPWRTWIVPAQRTQSISDAFVNRLEAEMVFI